MGDGRGVGGWQVVGLVGGGFPPAAAAAAAAAQLLLHPRGGALALAPTTLGTRGLATLASQPRRPTRRCVGG